MPSPKSEPKPKTNMVRIEFEAIGTGWNIDIFQDLSSSQIDKIKKTVIKRIGQFDKAYSRFRHDSLISQMAKKSGTYKLPTDSRKMVDYYKTLNMLSNGQVTPLIGQIMVDAGYDAEYSLAPKSPTRQKSWDEVIDWNYPNISVKEPALLDFGAAGKGYLVDIVSNIIEKLGYEEFLVNAGGDIVHHGQQTTVVGLEHPDDFSQAIGVVQLNNKSLCGSAGNRRAWADYNHIIDPVSLGSPKHIKATWVVAESGLIADGLATALYFVSPDKLRTKYNFEYAIVNDDLSLDYSPQFPATFFN